MFNFFTNWSSFTMSPMRLIAPNLIHRVAARACVCLLIWAVSAGAYSQEGKENADEVSRFNSIYDLMQSDREFSKRADELLGDFKRAFPKSPYLLILMGAMKAQEAARFSTPGALDEAMALAQQALKMNDGIADTYILLTQIYVQRQDAFNAKRMANRALSLAQSRPEAFSAMAQASQQNREFGLAAHWYERAANAFTNPIRKSNMYMWVYHALSDPERLPMDQRADLAKMQAALEQAIRLDPGDSSKNMYYGCFLIERKADLQQGRKVLEFALKTSKYPRNSLHCRNLADYLEWALSPSKDDAKSVVNAIAARTGMSVENAFVEAAAHPALESIPEAMLRTRVIANLNTIGNGVSRNRLSNATALANAAFGDNLQLVKKLVEAGANIHAEDIGGRTPLYYAIYSADGEMVEYFLQKGARPNIRDKNGETPLYISVFAAQRNHTQLVSTLLKYKANPLIPTAQGPAVALYAIGMTSEKLGLMGQNGVELLKAFLVGGHLDVNMKDSDGLTFLAVAVFNSEQVRYLLERGASPWVKIQGVDILDFYAPQLSSGFRDFKINQLEQSLKLIRDARTRGPAN